MSRDRQASGDPRKDGHRLLAEAIARAPENPRGYILAASDVSEEARREALDALESQRAATSAAPQPLGFARRAFGKFLKDLDPELPPGTRIDSYVVERILGKGGMGRVYLARRESPSGYVAIKVSLAGSELALKRFER